MKLPRFVSWRVRHYVCASMVVFSSACSSMPPPAAVPQKPLQRSEAVDDQCRLAAVTGDTRLVATDDGRVFLIGTGLGIMQSTDGAKSFSLVGSPPGISWPSITSHGPRVWASWIDRGDTSRVVVASIGFGVGASVVALTSTKTLIDTELVALGDGRLLLFATEVDGRPNANEATYTVQCVASEDGGLSWLQRSSAVTGPFGINIEDPRAVVHSDGAVLLAFEWETSEGGASEIMFQKSDDGGYSWSAASILWEDSGPADREPGGFVRVGSDLWFVASTDLQNPGDSYSGAEIAMIRSSDGGKTWTDPRVLIGEPDQISMGGVAVEGAVILPSVRRYSVAKERSIALYRVDAVGRWQVSCVRHGVFSAGFEEGDAGSWNR